MVGAEAAKPDWKEITASRLKLRKALAEKRFADLDTVLSRAHAAFLQNPAQETRLYWLYQIFEHLDKADSAALDQWVNQQPDRIAPLVARMMFRVQKGMAMRGHDRASETSKAQFANMRWQFELARQDARSALRLDSRLLLPHYTFIAIAATGGTLTEEWDAMSGAYQASPASFLCWRRFVWYQTPRWGGSYDAMRQYSDFIEELAELNPTLWQVRGLIVHDQAKVLRFDKKNHEALRALNRALASEPNSELYSDRGRMLMNQERYLEALRDLEKAETLMPLNGLVLARKAKCLLYLDRNAEAMRTYAFAKEQHPHDSDVADFPDDAFWILADKAQAEIEANRFDAALRLQSQAIALNPQTASAYYRRARTHALKDDYARAMVDLDEAIRLKPDFFKAYLLVDYVYARQGQWKSILKYWDTYITKFPDNDTAYFERSGTHFHAGNLGAAKADAERACRGGHAEACKLYRRKFGGVL